MNFLGDTFYSNEELRKVNFRHLGKNVKIKKNVGMFFCENISIHDNVRIDDFSIIIGTGQGLVIEKNVHFSARAYLVCYGGIEIKSYSTFGPNVSIFSASDDYTEGLLSNGTVDDKYKKLDVQKIYIGSGSIVGANCSLLPGSSLGIGASIGAHSLLKNQVNDYEIFAGIPAKKIGQKNEFNSEILSLLDE